MNALVPQDEPDDWQPLVITRIVLGGEPDFQLDNEGGLTPRYRLGIKLSRRVTTAEQRLLDDYRDIRNLSGSQFEMEVGASYPNLAALEADITELSRRAHGVENEATNAGLPGNR